ncbi:MAG: helix-hairpin-helix domain-containing protein [Ruminococcus sp.]|nr:helix-hairpin-helix domain-containing protein [Ruminococcus sp.]
MQDILFWVKKYLKDFIIIFLVLICVTIVVYTNWFKEEDNNTNYPDLALNLKNDEKEETEEKPKEKVYVDIKGAVKNPGVYEVLDNNIINDVITLAGGLNSNAYVKNINLSKKVKDEMVIYIYTKNEIKSFEEEKGEVSKIEECITSSYIITECEEEKSSIINVDSNTSSSKEEIKKEPNTDNKDNTNSTSLVNINKASINDFTKLSGIGEAKAKKIIEYREANGDFKDITEIMKVSGIGEKLFDTIKDFITI